MNQTETIAGTAFPFAIDPQTGGIAWARDREKIRQNIRILLSTRLGERPMQRNFGTRLPALVHGVNSAILSQIAITQTQEAMLQWEPRVLVTDATVEQQEGELKLNLRYAFLAEQTNDELALPLL
jgi:hypothetical protein